ncbi:porin [Cupriavidus necator]|nr:porin [Cupriavidus necator]
MNSSRIPPLARTLGAVGALGALAWAGSATASVQLYGAADSFLQYSRNAGQSSVRLLSGGASTSRWGIAGVEDLGGGLHASFRLESGIDLMTGRQQSATSMYNREANIALSSEDWGIVKLGKQYPAIGPESTDPFLQVAQLSPFASTVLAVSDLGPGVTAVQARVNNAITYETPSFGGLSVRTLYASRNAAGASPNAGNIGAVANFARGPLQLSGSYNAVWPTTAKTPGGVPDGPRTDMFMASSAYAFGALQGTFAYSMIRPTAPGTFVAQVFSLGAVWQHGPNVIRAGIAYRNVSGKADQALGALLGYDYQFSKLTGIYTRVGGFKNYGQSTIGFGSDPVTTPGASSLVVALGIRQKF